MSHLRIAYVKQRYTAIILILILLLSAFSLYGEEHAGVTDISFPDTVARGSLLTVIYHGERAISTFTIKLLTRETEIVDATVGFRYRIAPQKHIWIGLLGIDNAIAPGNYTITTVVRGFLYEHTDTHPLQVLPNSFDHETIALDKRLSTIRTAQAAKRAEQREELLKIVNAVGMHAIYDTQSLFPPTIMERITSGYGDRRIYHYSDNSNGSAIHYGIDLAAPIGQAVFASAAGRVRMAQDRIVTGNSIIIEHLPGLMTIYYHLDHIAVKKNEIVKRGDLIGSVGSTGLSTGPHLHWELRAAGTPVNPLPYLNKSLLDTNSKIY